jgi:hypothetical protein
MEVQLGEAINPPGRLHFNGEDSSQAQMPKASLLLARDQELQKSRHSINDISLALGKQ